MDTFDNICKIFQRYLTPRQEFKAALTRGRSPCTHTIHKLDISMICAYWCFLDWGNSTMDLLKHPICHSTFGQKSFDCFQLLMHHWFGFCFTWAFMLCFVFFWNFCCLSTIRSIEFIEEERCWLYMRLFWHSVHNFLKITLDIWDPGFQQSLHLFLRWTLQRWRRRGRLRQRNSSSLRHPGHLFLGFRRRREVYWGFLCFRFILLCRSHGWSVWLWHIHIGIDVTKYPLPYRFICSFFPHMRQTFPCEHVTSLCVLRSKVCCCTLWSITDEQPKTPCQAVSVWRYRNHGNSMLVDQRLDQGPVWFQPYWQLAMDIDRLMLHTDSKNIYSTIYKITIMGTLPQPSQSQKNPNTSKYLF